MSSSNSSHSRSHSSSQQTSKGKRFARAFLAFVLFLVLSALCFSVCARVTYIAPKKVAEIFSNHDYAQGVTEDARGYAHDICLASGVKEDTLDGVINYESMSRLQKAYGYGIYADTEDYTETTYNDILEDLQRSITAEFESAVKKQGIAVSPNVDKGSAKAAEALIKYIRSITEFRYSEEVKTIVTIGKNATLIAIIVFAFLAVILALIVVSIGSVRYRAMRMLVHSLNATGLLGVIVIIGVKVVEHFKTLYIFPMYLRESVLRHIDSCLYTTGYASAICFLLALVLASIIWKMNRNKNG